MMTAHTFRLKKWYQGREPYLYIQGQVNVGQTKTIGQTMAQKNKVPWVNHHVVLEALVDKYSIEYLKTLSCEDRSTLYFSYIYNEYPRAIIESDHLVWSKWNHLNLKHSPVIVLEHYPTQHHPLWDDVTPTRTQFQQALKQFRQYLTHAISISQEAYSTGYTPVPSEDFKGFFEIPGYSRYCASEEGFILTKKTRNKTRGALSGPYLRIDVYPDGENRSTLKYTHNLVCRAFYGPPEPGWVVLHLDNDKTNPHANNLRWGTQSENIQQVYQDGLR